MMVENDCPIKAMGTALVLTPHVSQEASNLKIMLPDGAREELSPFMEVLNVGPECILGFNVGDVVTYPITDYGVMKFTHDKIPYAIVKEEFVLARIEE